MLFAIDDRVIEEYVEKNLSYVKGDEYLEKIARHTFWNTVNPRMISGIIQARVLQFFVMMTKSKKILEIGTFTGYSAVAMANVLPEDGKIFSFEIDKELAGKAQSLISDTDVNEKIRIVTDDFDMILQKEGKESFDLIFVDAEKDEYINYFNKYLPFLSPTGVMIFDNVLWSKKIFDPRSRDRKTKHILEFNDYVKNHKEVINFILPVRDGLMLIMRNIGLDR